MHTVATILYLNKYFAFYVDPMYFATFYMNTYKYRLHGMNGGSMLPTIEYILSSTTEYTPPLPPLKRRMTCMPTVNVRWDASERTGRHIVSKVDKRVLCSVCKQAVRNGT